MRKIITCLTYVFLLYGQMYQVSAADSAKAHIETLGREAIDTLTSGGLGESEQRSKFLELLDRGFDVPAIARYVMGRHWRSLSESLQSSFVQKFRNDLSFQYANRFREYRGVDFHVRGVRDIGDGGYFVQSSLKKPGESIETAVEWKVYGNKILDVKVEGVSMSTTKRDEVYAGIQSQGGDPAKYVSGSRSGSTD